MSDSEREAFERAVDDAMAKLGAAITQAAMKAAEAFMALRQPLMRFGEALYQDEPMPGEEPVDYVMRVGARSGFFIYPDEAWRYRANLDWWKERNQ